MCVFFVRFVSYFVSISLNNKNQTQSISIFRIRISAVGSLSSGLFTLSLSPSLLYVKITVFAFLCALGKTKMENDKMCARRTINKSVICEVCANENSMWRCNYMFFLSVEKKTSEKTGGFVMKYHIEIHAVKSHNITEKIARTAITTQNILINKKISFENDTKLMMKSEIQSNAIRCQCVCVSLFCVRLGRQPSAISLQ